ncbi:unnamed protein product, partial [Polarella glacialis]
ARPTSWQRQRRTDARGGCFAGLHRRPLVRPVWFHIRGDQRRVQPIRKTTLFVQRCHSATFGGQIGKAGRGPTSIGQGLLGPE